MIFSLSLLCNDMLENYILRSIQTKYTHLISNNINNVLI